MNRQATVLVADPFPIFREGVCRAVRQHRDLALVSDVADGRAALRDIEALEPDVAVLGLPLGDVAGDRIPSAITRDALATRVVVVLTQPDAFLAYRVLERGALACFTRLTDPQTLIRGVAAAARFDTTLAPELQTGLVREMRRRNPHGRPVLSGREREVLGRVADGRCTANIAAALGIRESTVKTHVANAAEKLGAATRAAAVATAIRTGELR